MEILNDIRCNYKLKFQTTLTSNCTLGDKIPIVAQVAAAAGAGRGGGGEEGGGGVGW